jgi:hypothetical protein
MKTIWLFLALSASVITASAQVSEKDVKLLGVTSGLDSDVAIIEVRTPKRSPEDMILKAGQAMNGVEVLKIEGQGSVNVVVDGQARTLVLETDKNLPLANTNDRVSPVIHFRSIPLAIAIDLYAEFKNRIVMQHPELGNPTFSLDVNPRSKQEAAAIFEKMFKEQNIATIPDGKHFVMVVPFALASSLKPRAATLTQTNSMLGALSVNFQNAPMDMVLTTYADYVQKEVVNLHDGFRMSCCPTFTFYQTTPVSREELCYALETQIGWYNIRLVPAGDKWKWERITEPK